MWRGRLWWVGRHSRQRHNIRRCRGGRIYVAFTLPTFGWHIMWVVHSARWDTGFYMMKYLLWMGDTFLKNLNLKNLKFCTGQVQCTRPQFSIPVLGSCCWSLCTMLEGLGWHYLTLVNIQLIFDIWAFQNALPFAGAGLPQGEEEKRKWRAEISDLPWVGCDGTERC